MRATLLSVVLSLFIFPLLSHASPEKPEPGAIPIVTQESHLIDLNKADVDTLTQSFKGIGRKRAEAIVAYREANGGFKSLDDLALVKGIGKQFVERNRPQLQETYSVQ